ncbi:MAG: DUF2059 domain-containing protein [Bacteroidia bacterium]
MKRLTISILFCALSISMFAQSSTKTDKIKKMLELTGSANLGVQVAKQMINTFKQSYSSVGDAFWDDFEKEIKAEDLMDLIIPIYDKHYTEEDIDQLIAFYNSPIGKKMTENLPIIMQESMAAGQTWGSKIAEKAIERLRQKGY